MSFVHLFVAILMIMNYKVSGHKIHNIIDCNPDYAGQGYSSSKDNVVIMLEYKNYTGSQCIEQGIVGVGFPIIGAPIIPMQNAYYSDSIILLENQRNLNITIFNATDRLILNVNVPVSHFKLNVSGVYAFDLFAYIFKADNTFDTTSDHFVIEFEV